MTRLRAVGRYSSVHHSIPSSTEAREMHASACPSPEKLQQWRVASRIVFRLVNFALSALGPAHSRASFPANDRHFGNLTYPRRRAESAISFIQFAGVVTVTKLYVGNLPFDATEEAVRELFSAHGTVEKISLITDRDTGRPRGFGFVEMSNADASRAMQALNGSDFSGRSLRINEAQDRAGGGGGGRGPRRY